jgi:hypothetical protein
MKSNDLYVRRAAAMFDVPEEQVTPEQRKKAKDFTWYLAYSGGPIPFNRTGHPNKWPVLFDPLKWYSLDEIEWVCEFNRLEIQQDGQMLDIICPDPDHPCCRVAALVYDRDAGILGNINDISYEYKGSTLFILSHYNEAYIDRDIPTYNIEIPEGDTPFHFVSNLNLFFLEALASCDDGILTFDISRNPTLLSPEIVKNLWEPARDESDWAHYIQPVENPGPSQLALCGKCGRQGRRDRFFPVDPDIPDHYRPWVLICPVCAGIDGDDPIDGKCIDWDAYYDQTDRDRNSNFCAVYGVEPVKGFSWNNDLTPITDLLTMHFRAMSDASDMPLVPTYVFYVESDFDLYVQSGGERDFGQYKRDQFNVTGDLVSSGMIELFQFAKGCLAKDCADGNVKCEKGHTVQLCTLDHRDIQYRDKVFYCKECGTHMTPERTHVVVPSLAGPDGGASETDKVLAALDTDGRQKDQ